MLLGQAVGRLTGRQIKLLFSELADTAEQVERILADCDPAVETAADAMVDATSALFIGRGMGAATSYEGALKMKEISYLHAEAYAAGEMKHGPIALIDEGTSRGGHRDEEPRLRQGGVEFAGVPGPAAPCIIAVATEGDEEIAKHANHVIYVPKVRDAFSPITASVPLQLLSRAVAVKRGCDVDQPRNLAKSVTVE